MSAPSSAVWQVLPQARPLVAWSAAQREAVAGTLRSAAAAWGEDWGLPEQACGVACAGSACDASQEDWRRAGNVGEGTAWLQLPPSFDLRLARDLWGAEAVSSPVARRIVEACRGDLFSRLLGALRMSSSWEDGAARPAVASAWSGDVEFALGTQGRLRLDGDAVGRVLRSVSPGVAPPTAARREQRPLQSVVQAAAGTRLSLQVHLSECELDLGSLQDLRIGDVVPLRHRLDAPLLVRDAAGRSVFGAYLARRGRRKAIELAAVPGAQALPAGKVHP